MPPRDARAVLDAGCGAHAGSLCANGAKCGSAVDCQSGLCTGGVCTAPAPTCTDGVKNGMETDVDCGGPLCPKCAAGKDCAAGSDCVSLVCTGGVCQAPSPTDGVKNDSETDVDCGGALLAGGAPNPMSDQAPACATGKTCAIGSDCASNVCAMGPVLLDNLDGGVDANVTADAATGDGGARGPVCQPATDHDGVKNDSETDIDCGGALLASGASNPASDGAPVCTHGHTCLLGSDCDQGVCNANNDQGGGPIDCPAGAMCTCQVPWNNDGVKNDSETDVDCGGGASLGSDGAPPCAPGQSCLVASDCDSSVCTANKCAAPTATDGVKNDSETDVDCGGALLASGATNPASDQAPACTDDKTCALDSDCLSAYCSQVSGTCVDGQSCKGLITPAAIMDVTTPAGTTPGSADAIGTPNANGAGQSAGLDTCGVGESTDPVGQQQHESCCKSLPVTIAGTALRYDKYEVTAGRMRQFLESVGYDVRSWALAQFDASFNPITPAGTTLATELPIKQAGVVTNVLTLLPGTRSTSVPLNAVIQTGALVMDTAGSQGCYTGVGEFGAATYWWDGATLGDQASSPPRPFTQDYYDIKSINCIPGWLGAAFCAWDGGRLPLETEHKLVWNDGTATATQYPWGANMIPNPYPGNTALSGAAYQPAVAHTVDWKNSNLGSSTGQGNFYFYPSTPLGQPLDAPASVGSGLDLTPYTAAPGRFFLDRTALLVGGEGWQDLGANMIEMAGLANYSETSAFCDASGQLGTGESYNCNCPSNNCSNASCSGTGAHCGVSRGTVPIYALLGGSWEGHAIQETLTKTYPFSRQYGKLGLRCIRAAE